MDLWSGQLCGVYSQWERTKNEPSSATDECTDCGDENGRVVKATAESHCCPDAFLHSAVNVKEVCISEWKCGM